jgi:hypothetical protein
VKIKLQKRSFFLFCPQIIDFDDGVLFVKKVPDKFRSIGCSLKTVYFAGEFC